MLGNSVDDKTERLNINSTELVLEMRQHARIKVTKTDTTRVIDLTNFFFTNKVTFQKWGVGL